MDRRIAKTRRAIFNALLDLSAEKDLPKIKVIEICDKAEINKSTFYLHYRDINDCITKCIGYLIDSAEQLVGNSTYEEITTKPINFVSRVLEYVSKNSDLIEKYKKSSIFAITVSVLDKTFATKICTNSGIDVNSPKYLSVCFMVSGIMGCVYYSIPDYDPNVLGNVLVNELKKNN